VAFAEIDDRERHCFDFHPMAILSAGGKLRLGGVPAEPI